MPTVKKSLNIHKTIPAANPSVPQFLRQDLHEGQKGLEKQTIRGSDVPITQRQHHMTEGPCQKPKT